MTITSRPIPDVAVPAEPNRARRMGQQRWALWSSAVLAVAWAALIWLVDLPAAGYLAVGVLLVILVQLVLRRRSLVELWTSTRSLSPLSARHRAARALLISVVVTSLLLHGILTSDAWSDTATTLMVTGAIFVIAAPLRRLFVILVVATALLTGATVTLTPRLAAAQTGDPQLLAELGDVSGFHHLSVATVDLGADHHVRSAGFGSTDRTRFEAGSVTKAMTGLVIADEVGRGEINLDDPLSMYLAPLGGTSIGEATIRELVTHTSGLPRDSAATVRAGLWREPLGLNPLAGSLEQLLRDARTSPLTNRGSVTYSNTGAALAGQAAAVAAGMSYPDLMRVRLFEPLGMYDSAIQTRRLVSGGHSASGLPVRPWVFAAYAPAGGAVTTVHDLSLLATALLDGTAPGMNALEPLVQSHPAQPGQDGQEIGVFWHTNHWVDGRVVTWHDGMTAGYSALIYLDRPHQRASIVLADVALSGNEIGNQLLVG